MPSRTAIVLRSVLALVLAVIAVLLVNLAGGELAGLLHLPQGGDARLAYDLLWVFLGGVAGSALMVSVAAAAKTAHAWAFSALYLALGTYVAAVMWEDFPRWFTLGCLLTLPLQVWLGAKLGTRNEKRETRSEE